MNDSKNGSAKAEQADAIRNALAGVMHEDSIDEWLQVPNPALSGLRPSEVIERGELDRIWRMIHQLESGIPG